MKHDRIDQYIDLKYGALGRDMWQKKESVQDGVVHGSLGNQQVGVVVVDIYANQQNS